MAHKTVLVSDLTGQEIQTPATVTIAHANDPSTSVLLDVDASEVADMAAKGRQVKRRGRRPRQAQAQAQPEASTEADDE